MGLCTSGEVVSVQLFPVSGIPFRLQRYLNDGLEG